MYSRQEKNFMKDPATAAARIYVGNLDQKVVEDDLRTLFSPYGKILGISVQRNFGFIQFDSEASAALAIQKELGIVFKGKKLNVRGAITGEGGKGNNNLKNIQTTAQQQTPLNNESNMNVDEQQSITKDMKDATNNVQSIYPKRGGGGGIVGRSNNNNNNNNNSNSNNYRDRSPLDHQHHHYQQQQHRSSYASSFRELDRHLNDYTNTNVVSGGGGGVSTMLRKKIDCNDCEIIVVAKSLTEYAEYIEHKLKQLGITVDLLFPNEDVPIGRVLANIASRGCLYAILVTPQNEQYHSLTLNILYGAPEEHRNMPTDDAINLINKNFECYIRNGGNCNINTTTTTTTTNININNILNKLLIKHSDTIQILLNLLTENRQLTVAQYEKLIKYLQERKQLQQQYEYETITTTQTTTATANNNNINIDEQQQQQQQANELQTRILNILNNTTTTTANNNNIDNNNIDKSNQENVINDIVTSVISKINNNNKSTTTTTSSACISSSLSLSLADNNILTTTPTTTTAVTASTSTPPPLLNDPSVQKALDSLLQADLLKNITINKQQLSSASASASSSLLNNSNSNNNNSNSNSNSNNDNNNYGTNYSSNVRRF